MPQIANIDLNNLTPDQGFLVIDSSFSEGDQMAANSLGAITGTGLGAIAYVARITGYDDYQPATIKIAFGTTNITDGEPFDMAQRMNGQDGVEIIVAHSTSNDVFSLGDVFGGDFDAFAIMPTDYEVIVIPGSNNWQSPVTINNWSGVTIPGASTINVGSQASDMYIPFANYDINGDGLPDIVTNTKTQTCIYFGSINGFPQNMNQSYINGNTGTCITVQFQGNSLYIPMFPISSVNNDIYDDLLACNPLASAYPDILASGQCVVIYGKPTFQAAETITVGEPFSGMVINGPMYNFAGISCNYGYGTPTINNNNIILTCSAPECSNQLAVILGRQNLPDVMYYNESDYFLTGVSNYWSTGDFNRDGVSDLGVMINGTIPAIVMSKSFAPQGNVSYKDTNYVTISSLTNRMACTPLRDFDGDGYPELFCANHEGDTSNSTIIGYVLYSDDGY